MSERNWRGAFKLIEECGELTTVLGKLGPFPDGDHPDGKGHLFRRIEDELADVQAAITYFIKENGFDVGYVADRAKLKLEKFEAWGLTSLK